MPSSNVAHLVFLVNLAALSSRLRGSLYQNDLHLVTLRGGDLRGFRKELSESLILFVQLCASWRIVTGGDCPAGVFMTYSNQHHYKRPGTRQWVAAFLITQVTTHCRWWNHRNWKPGPPISYCLELCMLCSVLPGISNRQCNEYGNYHYPCYASHYRYYTRNRSCNHFVPTFLLEFLE